MSDLRAAESFPRLPWVWFVLLVAVRLAMVAGQPFLAARVPEWAWANNDGYDTIAIHWVQTGVFALEREVPTAIRLPLYPALIAVAYRTGGAAYPWLVMGMQAVLSIWTGWWLFRMTAGLFGRRSGLAALVLFIFHPQVNHFIFRCATETLFMFLLVGLVHAAVLFLRTRAPRHLMGAAAAMGLSLLTRQTLLPLAWLALAALLGWSFGGRRGIGRRLGWTAVAVSVVGLLLAPWLARNWVQSGGHWVLQTWIGQPMCQGAYVTRHLDEFFAGRKTLTELDQAGLFEIRFLERQMSRRLPAEVQGIAREVASDQYFRDRARQLAARAPLDRARRTVGNLLWAPVLQMTWKSTRILMLWNWPLLVFGLAGLVACARRNPRRLLEAAPIWIAFGYLLVAHAAAWPQARYVLPGLVPFMAFSAVGLDAGFSALGAWGPRKPPRHRSAT